MTPTRPSHKCTGNKNLGSAAVRTQDFRRMAQRSEKVFCVLCMLVSGKAFFFFALFYFGVLLFPNLAYIQDNQGTVKGKKGAKTAWQMWPVGPAPAARPWEGVSGLGASGPCLVCAPVAQRPPAFRGQGSSADRPLLAPFSWGCSQPGRAATELTVLSPEIWLLQMDTSTPRVLSEGQSGRPQLWPPCS